MYLELKQNHKLVAVLNDDDLIDDPIRKSSLNREYTLEFSIAMDNEKAKYITADTKIHVDGFVYTLNFEGAIEEEYENKNVIHVRGEGLYKDLENYFVEPFLSNDPNTPVPADLTVMMVGGGKDLTDGKYKVGTAANVLYSILKAVDWDRGDDWTIGTVDVEGIFDLEVEKKSVLGLIQAVQNIWGGYLVWDFENRVVHLRDEKKWAINRGYRLNENKNVRINKKPLDKVQTRLYPFGENNLDIAKVNNGIKYLGKGKTAMLCFNFNIKDQEELLKWGKEQLAYYSKPRYNYTCDIVDVRYLEGYESEVFELGDLVRIRTKKDDLSEPIRIMSIERNLLKPYEVRLEIGEPILKLEDVLKASMDTTDTVGKTISPDGKIDGRRLLDSSVIADSIDEGAIDASKFNVKQIILTGDEVKDNEANKFITWNTHNLFYDGKKYEIQAGRSYKKYVVWRQGSNKYENLSEVELENKPLGDNDFVIYVNNDGKHDVAWYSRVARQFVGATFIADASINDAKIRDLSAVKITTGLLKSVNGDTWIDMDTGDFSFKNGALRWNSEKGELEIGMNNNINDLLGDVNDKIDNTKTEINKTIQESIDGAKQEINTNINKVVETQDQKLAELEKKTNETAKQLLEKAQEQNRIWYVESESDLNTGGVKGKTWAELTPTRPNNADHNGDVAVIGGMTDNFMQNMKVYYNSKWIPLAEGAFLIEDENYNGVKIGKQGIQIYNSNGTKKSELNKDFLRFYGSPTKLPESYTSTVPFSEVNTGGMQFIGQYGTSPYLKDVFITRASTWNGKKGFRADWDIGTPGANGYVEIQLPERFKNYKKEDVEIAIIPIPEQDVHTELRGYNSYATTEQIVLFENLVEAKDEYNWIGTGRNCVGVSAYKIEWSSAITDIRGRTIELDKPRRWSTYGIGFFIILLAR